jgi:hypothetical protein
MWTPKYCISLADALTILATFQHSKMLQGFPLLRVMLFTHAQYTETLMKRKVDSSIDDTISKYCNNIKQCALGERELPMWEPPRGINEPLCSHISTLRIPALNSMPSLLLHELGKWPESTTKPVLHVFHAKNMYIIFAYCYFFLAADFSCL